MREQIQPCSVRPALCNTGSPEQNLRATRVAMFIHPHGSKSSSDVSFNYFNFPVAPVFAPR